MSISIALTTLSDLDKAREIAQRLVEEKLAACVNIIPSVESIYHWQGKLHRDSELLLVVKTTKSNVPALEKRLHELHPYDTPEFVVLESDHTSQRYLAWVAECTTKKT